MTAIDRPFAYVVIGQSYGYIGHNNGHSFAPFIKLVSAAVQANASLVSSRLAGAPTLTAASLPQMRMLATPGSSVLKKFQGAASYWVEDDGVTPGPLLSAAVTTITNLTTKPTIVIYSHGEQESAAGISSAGDITLFKTGVATIFSSIRAACYASSPTSVPVFVDMLGPRYPADEASEIKVRAALIDIIAAGANVYRGAEKYAAKLAADTHPTRDRSGYGFLGAHEGRKVNGWLLNSIPAAPTIASAVRTGNSVAVTINVPSGGTLVKPSSPDFFGLYTAGGAAIAITSYSWNSNVLTITGASQPATLRYPIQTNRVEDISKVIRLSSPGDAVFTGEPGLVLESAKDFML